jgi:hypothetical protein
MFPSVILVFGAGHPRVTHPSAADGLRRDLIARLACIKRAASVHPEPRSNSPFDSFPNSFEFWVFFVLLALCCSASCYYSAVKVLAPVFPTVKPMFRALSALLIGPGNLLKPLLRSLATIYCPEVALSIPYALPVSSLSRTFVRP